MGVYCDNVLEPMDVCSNCLLVTRVKRVDPVRVTEKLDSKYQRHNRRTQIGYGPADRASEIKGTFCNCGVEGNRVQDRSWDSDDVTDAKFRELLKSLLRTLEEKDVTVDRKRVVSTALSAWYRDGDVDEALSEGVEMGIVASLAAEASEARV